MLDDGQRAVVESVAASSGCLLVTGGPGSGKTTALVAAAAALVRRGVPLERVVVLTQARPAAQRLRREIMAAVGVTQIGPRITTVHGWCQALLARYGDPEVPWRLISAPEQEFRVRELLGTNWPPDLAQAATAPAFAGQLRFLFARARQLGLDPADLARAGQVAGRQDWVAAASFFSEYLDVLDAEAVIDYAELVHRCRILMAEESVRAGVLAHTTAVLVDEFAECDESVVALLRDIWRAGVPVTAFGDATTAVFGFRGAWPASLRRFPEEFADANGPAPVVALTGDYRVAGRREAWLADSPDDEAALIAQRLWLARADGVSWSDMAVIARAGGPRLARLAGGLSEAGVPVNLEGEILALADVPAVKVLMNALRLLAAASPDQDQDDWTEVLCSPVVGLDEVDLRRLARLVADGVLLVGEDADIWARAEKARAGLRELAGEVPSCHVSELAWQVWTLSGWPERLRAEALGRGAGAPRADRDLDAVIALFDLAGAQPQWRGADGVAALAGLVSQQVVQRDRARETGAPDAVTVLSAYQAKGRGWPVVAVAGAAEGTWPMDGIAGSLLEPERLIAEGQSAPVTRRDQVAAERRLFRLAVSRSADRLILSAPGVDGETPVASRFIAGLGLEAERWQPAAKPAGGAGGTRALVGQLRTVAMSDDESPALVAAAIDCLRKLKVDPSGWWWVGGPTPGGQPVAADGPVRLAATTLAQALACPRAWFLQSNGGAPRPGVQMGFGSIAHRLFDACAAGTPDLAALWEQVQDDWAGLPYGSAWQSAAGRASLEEAVERFLVWRDGRGGRRLLGTEIEFDSVWSTPAGDAKVRGRVDRLEQDEAGQLVIIDFKTGIRADPKAHADQMSMYALAAGRGVFDEFAPGVRAVTTELVWPRIEPRSRNGGDVGCRVDRLEPDADVIERLGDVVAMVKSERFDATPGAACRYCAFLAGCPAEMRVGDDQL